MCKSSHWFCFLVDMFVIILFFMALVKGAISCKIMYHKNLCISCIFAEILGSKSWVQLTVYIQDHCFQREKSYTGISLTDHFNTDLSTLCKKIPRCSGEVTTRQLATVVLPLITTSMVCLSIEFLNSHLPTCFLWLPYIFMNIIYTHS